MPAPTTPDPQAGAGAAAGAATPDPKTGDAATGAAAGTGSALNLTQAELDAIILNRTAQARKVASDAAEKARQWDAYQASQQTEAEKAAAKTAAEEKRLADLTAKTNSRAVAAEVRLVAIEKGVRKEALGIVATLLANSTEITVSDDGSVVGAEAAVNKLLTENKYLLTEKVAPGRAGAEFTGETPGTGGSDTEKLAAARKAGRAGVQDSIGLKLKQLAAH
jgi:hypothetical protein